MLRRNNANSTAVLVSNESMLLPEMRCLQTSLKFLAAFQQERLCSKVHLELLLNLLCHVSCSFVICMIAYYTTRNMPFINNIFWGGYLFMRLYLLGCRAGAWKTQKIAGGRRDASASSLTPVQDNSGYCLVSDAYSMICSGFFSPLYLAQFRY